MPQSVVPLSPSTFKADDAEGSQRSPLPWQTHRSPPEAGQFRCSARLRGAQIGDPAGQIVVSELEAGLLSDPGVVHPAGRILRQRPRLSRQNGPWEPRQRGRSSAPLTRLSSLLTEIGVILVFVAGAYWQTPLNDHNS
jgi:hypothetical protein